MAQEHISTTEATQWAIQILDAKYEKADLQAVIDLQELERFTFSTALDLHMDYYTIRLDPDMTTSAQSFSPGGNIPTSGYR